MSKSSTARGAVSRSAALALALVVSAACLICACGGEAAEPVTAPLDQAKDLAAKAAVLAIATGVKAHVATTGEAPAEASQATLGAFVSPWPDNPFIGAPMQAGSSPGDYVYRQLSGGAYELSVHLSDGTLSPAP
ncbi:MAG: hypothetical protein V2J16_04680 [Thermoleophilia bacterium]|jgi:hypothetical protein|nr:hypothetical protein [Thermoleophilia bacterium]